MTKIAVITLLFIGHTIHGADDSYQLEPGMWGTDGYTHEKYWYRGNDLPELSAEFVTTPYWQQLKNSSQENKNRVLVVGIKAYEKCKIGYLDCRANIYATLSCGAQSETKTALPLHLAATNNDIPLAQWLLEEVKIDIHLQDTVKESAIHDAGSQAMHELLAKHGALKKPSELKGLLNSIARNQYCPPALISHYRNLNCHYQTLNNDWASPLATNGQEVTPLFTLCYNLRNYSSKIELKNAVIKAKLLLDNLTKNETRKVLSSEKPGLKKTLFDLLRREKEYALRYKKPAEEIERLFLEKLIWTEEVCVMCTKTLSLDNIFP